MSWFKRKKKTETDVRVIELTLAGIARQIVHDGVLGDPLDIARRIDLPPLSEDVLEMEEEASHLRLQTIDRYMPLLELHAQVMGEICLASYQISNPEREMGEEQAEEMETLFRLVSFSSALTSLTLLTDLGLMIPEDQL